MKSVLLHLDSAAPEHPQLPLPEGRITTEKCQRVKGIESHHESNAAVIANTGTIHQWRLKLMGKSLKRSKIIHSNPVPSHPKILINYKGKNCKFTLEKVGQHHLIQVTKVNLTSNETSTFCVPDYGTEKGITLAYSCPRV